jgi:small GTP-binding protein
MPRRDSLQDALNYQQAKQSLRHLLCSLDPKVATELKLEKEVYCLTTLWQKLEADLIQIAAFGLVGRGKSSLLNALLGSSVFLTGPTHGVTQESQRALWILESGVCVELIDTPGLDEVAGESRAELAYEIAKQVDLILFVIAGDMTRLELEALGRLREAGKPIILVFNKVDQYTEVNREMIYATLCDHRVKDLLTPAEIVMTAASPRFVQVVSQGGSHFTTELQQGSANVDELRLKIIEVLHGEGRSLLALNSLLLADQIYQTWIQRKLESQAQASEELVWKIARIKALVVGVIPVTIVDVLGGLILDVILIQSLAHLYGLSMTSQGAIWILQRLMISMLTVALGEWVALWSLGSLKLIFGAIGEWGAYSSGALMQATWGGMSSYAIGKAAQLYLAHGASWERHGSKWAIQQILSTLDEKSITARIRPELQRYLRGQR